jgi:hypothetical protein
MANIQAFILASRQGPLIVACVVLLAVVMAAYLRGYASGKQSAQAHYNQLLAERDQAALKQLTEAVIRERQAAEAAAAIEREHLEAELKRAQQQQVVTKVVKEYVHARPDLNRCSLDADGLRLWNAANAGKQSRASAQRKAHTRGPHGSVR